MTDDKKAKEYERAHIREWHWLTSLPGIGSKKIASLNKAVENVCDLYNLPADVGMDKAGEFIGRIYAASGIRYTDKDIQALLDERLKKKLSIEYEKLLSSDVKLVSIDSEIYPKRLRDIFDVPYILYYKGSLPDSDRKTAAIVGARACSEYGRIMAKDIAKQLAMRDVQIISGFARGIDTASHNGSLSVRGGRTFAVFGSGVNYCYPPENRFTYDEIIANGGGIISEYPPDMKPSSGFFPMRNRIISGLADVVIVVEADEKSGSLITADHALEQGRIVMAVPGRVTDRLSTGCNRLIRQGAAIASCMEDIYFELGITTGKEQKIDVLQRDKQNIMNFSQIKLEMPEKMLYSQLDFNPQSVDDLIRRSGLAPEVVSGGLVRLELAGLACRRGGLYVRGE